jgi:hypothetical protein
MQKVTTQGYEVLARLLSVDPLYQIKIAETYYITTTLIEPHSFIWDMLKIRGKNNHLKSFAIIASSHTVRGVWKKACKVLNGKVNNV